MHRLSFWGVRIAAAVLKPQGMAAFGTNRLGVEHHFWMFWAGVADVTACARA